MREGGAGAQEFVYQKWPDKIFRIFNSIAFGSAPRREADGQPISQLARQAVSQAVSQASRQADRQTETRSLGVSSSGLGDKHGARIIVDQPAVEWKCYLPPTVMSALRVLAGRSSAVPAHLSALLSLTLVQILLSTDF